MGKHKWHKKIPGSLNALEKMTKESVEKATGSSPSKKPAEDPLSFAAAQIAKEIDDAILESITNMPKEKLLGPNPCLEIDLKPASTEFDLKFTPVKPVSVPFNPKKGIVPAPGLYDPSLPNYGQTVPLDDVTIMKQLNEKALEELQEKAIIPAPKAYGQMSKKLMKELTFAKLYGAAPAALMSHLKINYDTEGLEPQIELYKIKQELYEAAPALLDWAKEKAYIPGNHILHYEANMGLEAGKSLEEKLYGGPVPSMKDNPPGDFKMLIMGEWGVDATIPKEEDLKTLGPEETALKVEDLKAVYKSVGELYEKMAATQAPAPSDPWVDLEKKIAGKLGVPKEYLYGTPPVPQIPVYDKKDPEYLTKLLFHKTISTLGLPPGAVAVIEFRLEGTQDNGLSITGVGLGMPPLYLSADEVKYWSHIDSHNRVLTTILRFFRESLIANDAPVTHFPSTHDGAYKELNTSKIAVEVPMAQGAIGSPYFKAVVHLSWYRKPSSMERLRFAQLPDEFTINDLIKLKGYAGFYRRYFSKEDVALWVTESLPMCCPYATASDLVTATAFDSYLYGVERHHFQKDPTAPSREEQSTRFEVVITGLTKEEAHQMLKNAKKGKEVLVATRKMKDIGTGSKAIIKWEFESSSMVANGAAVKYIAQLNEDGTLSCQCRGWTQGSAKNAEGRFCKHTRALEEEFNIKDLYKKWKKGEPLGEGFAIASDANGEIKPAGTTKSMDVLYKATRVVEI